jgi:hypothetical protein
VQVFFGKIELAGQRAESVSGFVIRTQNAIDVEECFRADDVTIFDRKNKRTTITFTARRLHATPEEAATFITEHTLDLYGKGTVKLVTQRGNRFLYGAGIEYGEGSYKGCTSTFKYTIQGGRISKEVKPQ